jgi:UDP-N-acetylglucosamine:LPS N-acetylglucosamine transferase
MILTLVANLSTPNDHLIKRLNKDSIHRDKLSPQIQQVAISKLFFQVHCFDPEIQNKFEEFLKKQRKKGKEDNQRQASVFLHLHGFQSKVNSHYIESLKLNFSEIFRDAKYVEIILESYSKYIFDSNFYQNPQALGLLTFWIQINMHYLALGDILSELFLLDMQTTSHFFKNLKADEQAILKPFLEDHSQIQCMHKNMTAFLQAVSDYDAKKYWKAKTKAVSDPSLIGKKIALITERNGGGHIAQAKAIEEFLKQQGFFLQTIEFELIGKSFDPLNKNQIKFDDGSEATQGEVYNKLSAQGKEPFQASFLNSYAFFLSQQYPELYLKNEIKFLMKKLRRMQPDLILNNLPYNPTFYPLPFRLNCPMEIIHPDFVFHPACVSLYQRQQDLPSYLRLLGFGVPCADPIIFPDTVNSCDPSIHIVGFPTRRSFTPIKDPDKIKALRQKYEIQEGHLVYSISRGFLGALEHLKECVDQLIDSQTAPCLPVDVIVICGENIESKAFLENYTQAFPQPTKPLTFHILGLMTAEQMNEIFQISNISDIKAGGGTSQEFLVSVGLEGSTRRAISNPAYPWEKPNATYLEKTGLAKIYDPSNPDQKDKIALLNELIGQPSIPAPLVDWKQGLLEMIKLRIQSNSMREQE